MLPEIPVWIRLRRESTGSYMDTTIMIKVSEPRPFYSGELLELVECVCHYNWSDWELVQYKLSQSVSDRNQ